MNPWTTVALCALVVLALVAGRWLGSVASAVQFDRRCRIVNALRGGKRSTAMEICQRIGVHTGTIHADLAALVRGKLIVREETWSAPYDRYVYLYRLRTDFVDNDGASS